MIYAFPAVAVCDCDRPANAQIASVICLAHACDMWMWLLIGTCRWPNSVQLICLIVAVPQGEEGEKNIITQKSSVLNVISFKHPATASSTLERLSSSALGAITDASVAACSHEARKHITRCSAACKCGAFASVSVANRCSSSAAEQTNKPHSTRRTNWHLKIACVVAQWRVPLPCILVPVYVTCNESALCSTRRHQVGRFRDHYHAAPGAQVVAHFVRTCVACARREHGE